MGDEVLFTDLLLCCHGGLLLGFHFPESGLNCAPDCCLLRAEMYAEGHSVQQWLEFDQRVSSQELSLVELDNCQDVFVCLIEASRRISQLLLEDQCPLVDQTVHQPT